MTDLTSSSKEVALDQGLNRAILIIAVFSPSQREPQTLVLSWVGWWGRGRGGHVWRVGRSRQDWAVLQGAWSRVGGPWLGQREEGATLPRRMRNWRSSLGSLS